MISSKTKRLAIDAMLAAVCAVLGSIPPIGTIKLTFEALPVFLGALLLGPLHGAVIGTLGTFVYQFLEYGLTVTTPLWILPYTAAGLVLGLFAKRCGYEPDRKKLIIVMILTELLITALNTGAIYVDSIIFGYYSKAYVFGSLAIRALLSVAKGAVFGAIIPSLLNAVKKITYGNK